MLLCSAAAVAWENFLYVFSSSSSSVLSFCVDLVVAPLLPPSINQRGEASTEPCLFLACKEEVGSSSADPSSVVCCSQRVQLWSLQDLSAWGRKHNMPACFLSSRVTDRKGFYFSMEKLLVHICLPTSTDSYPQNLWLPVKLGFCLNVDNFWVSSCHWYPLSNAKMCQ